MVRIRRFGIVRTANMAAALYAVIVLFVTLVFLLPITLLGLAVAPNSGGAGMAGGAAGVLVIALLGTVLYAVIGWVMTAIACAIYNLVAGWVGGIEVEVEPTTPTAPPWGYPGYGAPGGYPGQYGAPGQYAAPDQYGPSFPPPPGTSA